MSELDTHQLTAQADDLLARGNLSEAMAIYRQICTRDHGNSDAWTMLGAISAELGHLPDAVAHLKNAIAIEDGNVGAHYSLAGVLRAQGDMEDALHHLRCALAHAPDYAEAWVMLGGIRGLQGDYTQAMEYCQRAIALQPDSIDAHMNLGNAALQLGRLSDAAASYRTVVALQPNLAMPWLQLGTTALQLDDVESARNSLQRAIAIDPACIDALLQLGHLLRRQGARDEAAACYRQILALNPNLTDIHCELGGLLTERGLTDDAAVCFEHAVALAPTSATAHAGLGTVLQTQGRHTAAIAAFRQALQLAPESADLYTNLSTSYQRMGNLDEAEDCLRQALRIDPALAEAHNNLGSVLKAAGRMEEAVACLQQALALKPDFIGAQSNYLLSLNYLPSYTPDEMFRAHKSWGSALEQRTKAPTVYTNARDPGRTLRIGYVSPDLRTHAVAGFLQPILEHHNADRFHITCYADVLRPDDVTAYLRGLSQEWRSTCGLSDERFIDLVRDDGIDILVDLAGHTANNRLSVFAAKAAPVQFSYLGYANTTGLSRVDYRLTDAIADPPGSEPYYTEKLLYLDGGFTCYAPPRDVPAVARLPALRNGYITFGSMANLCKLNDRTLDLWCGVLRSLPTARFLFYRHLLKGRALDKLRHAFESRGIESERISLLGDIPLEYQALPFGRRYYGFFERIDIMLDTTPWNSHTTACEALWMGVPIITLTGDRHAGRICASVLTATDLSALVARNEEEYVSIAADFSHDIDRLVHLRSALRGRMQQSRLCDGASFTITLEQAYRSVWDRWCLTGTHHSP